MEVIELPTLLNIEGSDSFKVYDYQTSTECTKQMVSLKQNTFSFLTEGRKEVYADKSSFAIDNTSFLLMKMGNCLMTERLPNAVENYRSMLFFFSSDAILKFTQKHRIAASASSSRQAIYAFEYDDYLRTFVRGLIDISKLSWPVKAKLLEVKFEELMIYLIERYGSDFIFSLISNESGHTHRFKELVETNKLNKLSVNELAFLANMSVSTFKREFAKHFHSSPSKWFQDQRLAYAAFLLTSKSKRPSDIYEEIGYETLSNFIQAFKTKYGVTPKQHQTN